MGCHFLFQGIIDFKRHDNIVAPLALDLYVEVFMHEMIQCLRFFYWGVVAFVWDFKNNIYLAVPGLSCSMWELVPRPGTEPRPPPLSSLSNWTTM